MLRAANLLLLGSPLVLSGAVNLSTGAEAADWPDRVGCPAYAGLIIAHVVYVWLGLFVKSEPGSCPLETTKTTAKIFTILIGAILLNKFLALARPAAALGPWVEGSSAEPFATIAV